MNLLITKDSILNKIPANLDKKQIFLIEGIRYCANSISLSYEHLYAEIVKLSFADDKKQSQNDSFYIVIHEAWNLIDWTYRLTLLISSISLKEINKPIGENFSYLLKTKEFRNTLQHLTERIDEKILSLNAPVWGSISWNQFVRKDLYREFTLFAGHVRNNFVFRINNPLAFTSVSTIDHITLDAVIRRPNYHIESIDLSELFQRTQTIIKKSETDIEKQFEHHLQNGILPQDYLLSIDFQPDIEDETPSNK